MKLSTKIMGAAFAVAMLSTTAHASVGIKGGLGYTGNTATNSSYAPGFLVGAGVNLGMMPVGLMIDVLYGMRKVSVDAGAVSVDLKYNAVEVPVQVAFNMGPAFLSAGGFADFLVGKYTVDGVEQTDSSSSSYGAIAGIGAKMMHFQVEARYKFGLKDLDSGGDSKARSIDVLVGYYF
ncbi:MAG: porin family protein [Bdellovibrionales bacterium]|nr:porin family protein [Bdellovibrionales bacterium]